MNMKMTKSTVTAGILSVCVAVAPLTSCTSDDGLNTQLQGSTLGAIGGAVVGGAIGLAAGGDSKSVIAGAIAGGIAGGIAGLVWANSVVKEKAAYASMEDYINDNIRQLDARTAEAKKNNATLAKTISDLRAKKTKLSASDYQSQAKKINSGLALIDTDISIAKDAVNEASGAERAKLLSQISTLEAEKKTCQSNLATLKSLSSL